MLLPILAGDFFAVAVHSNTASGKRCKTLVIAILPMIVIGLVGAPCARGVQIVASQDTWITELAPDLDNLGTGTILAMRSSNPAGQNAFPYLQFKISSLTSEVFSASLNVTANQTSSNPTFKIHVFGGFEADAGTWSEAVGVGTPTWNSAALMHPDGVGLVQEIGDGSTLLDQWDLVPNGDLDAANSKVTFLGSISFSAVLNETMSFSSAALINFLNTARSNSDGTVTIVLAAEPHAVNSNFRMYSKEATDDLGIAGVDTLLTNAMRPNLAVNEVTPGDFDSDGDVDGADFVAWQTNFPKASDATRAQGDADANGNVDGADFSAWQSNFQTTPTTVAVAEPASNTLAMLGGLVGLSICRRTRRRLH